MVLREFLFLLYQTVLHVGIKTLWDLRKYFVTWRISECVGERDQRVMEYCYGEMQREDDEKM